MKIGYKLQIWKGSIPLTCRVLMESLTASTGTYVPARILVKRGVRSTAPSVVQTVITIDNGTSPWAIKVTCNINSDTELSSNFLQLLMIMFKYLC